MYALPGLNQYISVEVQDVGNTKYTVIKHMQDGNPILLPNRTGMIQTHFEGARFVISDGYTRQKKGVPDG